MLETIFEGNQQLPEQYDYQARFTSIGSHPYTVQGMNPITAKRGVEFAGNLDKKYLVDHAAYKDGWYEYYLTPAAFKKLHSNSHVCLLVEPD